MKTKIVAQQQDNVLQSRLEVIFRNAVYVAAKNKVKYLFRFEVDVKTSKIKPWPEAFIYKNDQELKIRTCRYVKFIDAHYHPNEDLELSSTDQAAMRKNNLFGIIIYADSGKYKVHLNTKYAPEGKIAELEIYYGYCNIQKNLGKSIGQLLGLDNERTKLIMEKLQADIERLEKKIAQFAGKGNAPDSLTSKLENWIMSNYSDKIDHLNLDDHDISHSIEDFMEKYPDFRKYRNPERIDQLAKMLFEKIVQVSYEKCGDEKFKKAFLEQIKQRLTTGGEESFINSFTTDLENILVKAEDIVGGKVSPSTNMDNSKPRLKIDDLFDETDTNVRRRTA